MLSESNLYDTAVLLVESARFQIVNHVNDTMVKTYYKIGRMIVSLEKQTPEDNKYGTYLIKNLSSKLTKEFGKGFSRRNIEQMRQFYKVFEIAQTLSAQSQILYSYSENVLDFKLSWSHYLKLMRIEEADERGFYEIEAIKNNWSVRELTRQYDSSLYHRLKLSRNKKKVKQLAKRGLIIEKPIDAIKDPYIFEFIGLPEYSSYTETEFEEAIISKLEHFLLELGTGFTFVARQKRMTFDDKHFRVDLVFYNRILNCFVLIDLKIGELKHQDIGQMQMYVNYYDREIKLDDENKTIGIILCQNKSEAVVKYTLPKNNKQIFASKYKTVLPDKDDLKALLKFK